MEKNQFLITKVFTVPYFDSLVEKKHVPDSFLKCISRYVKENDELTYGKAISRIYEYMNSEYRNEYYYKNTIFNQLLIQKHDLYNTAALTELPISKSKADFVMINGKGVVYEIKTDLDNFQRLQSQINDYYKVFSYVNVVVSKRQVEKVKEFLKDSKVGIFELTKSGKLICRKKAYCNNDELSYEVMFQVLRKKEFEKILLDYFGKLPEVNSFEYYRECLRWIKKINIVGLQKKIMICLKQRTILSIEDVFEKRVPNELSFYVYFSKKYRSNYDALDEFLNKKVEV
ncbi:MAG: sce7726 family protein [Lachnospiraceae bacterium]|jgi:hypothetical protein|nr:sce7726 family protein [Lachnospiraceae bacterium]